MTISKPRPKHHAPRRAEDDGRALSRAILKLPVDLRDVFLLNRMVGLTYDEIGLRLGMDPEAVQAGLTAALVHLMQAVRASEI